MPLKGIAVFLCVLLLLCGCKNKDACENMVCGANEVCEDGKCQPNYICGAHQHYEGGACVCDSGWYGFDCNKACTDCGAHGQCKEDWCECDTGWIGAGCQVPLSSYAGRYHMIGRTIRHLINNTDTFYIDDTIDIMWEGTALMTTDGTYSLDKSSIDSPYYSFIYPQNSFYSASFRFKMMADDSVFFRSHSHGISHSSATSSAGIRIN